MTHLINHAEMTDSDRKGLYRLGHAAVWAAQSPSTIPSGSLSQHRTMRSAFTSCDGNHSFG